MRALLLLGAVLLAGAGGCAGPPTITLTRVPPSSEGGPDRVELIEGRVSRTEPGGPVRAT